MGVDFGVDSFEFVFYEMVLGTRGRGEFLGQRVDDSQGVGKDSFGEISHEGEGFLEGEETAAIRP